MDHISQAASVTTKDVDSPVYVALSAAEREAVDTSPFGAHMALNLTALTTRRLSHHARNLYWELGIHGQPMTHEQLLAAVPMSHNKLRRALAQLDAQGLVNLNSVAPEGGQ
ncbi:hypothetical protein [Nocardia sp. SC052]|uniref:hypothetical protein n=1 Tax=Nocardia sichangensis TaxID=3385975 RepID=UPI00399FFB24